MNRGLHGVFHSAVQSYFAVAVNAMWKLCKAGKKLGARPRYGTGSEKFGTDFSHEGSGGNPVTTGELARFSTSARGLLLLLVL